MLTVVSVNIDKCLQSKIFVCYYDLLAVNALKKRYSFLSRDREDLGSNSKAHPRKNLQTCLKNFEVTLQTFWKISTRSSTCHEVPNELSTLLSQAATR